MSVLPDYQNRGIGVQLVNEGFKILKKSDCPFIIVLGHPKYYPRFGFKPASKYGIQCQWEGVPDAAFMVRIFNKGIIKGVSGVAGYRNEFNEAM
jgi:putative acetyltransferase